MIEKSAQYQNNDLIRPPIAGTIINRKEFLFVYGTLRKNGGNSHYNILIENSLFKSDATFCGKLFEISNYPGAILSNNLNDEIKGEVYSLNNNSNILSILDEYEECSDNFKQPTLFLREKHIVTLSNKMKLLAWIYLFNQSIEDFSQIISGDYLNK
jgi:pyruvate carboxylase